MKTKFQELTDNLIKATNFYTTINIYSIKLYLKCIPKCRKTAVQVLKEHLCDRKIGPGEFERTTGMTNDMYNDIMHERTKDPKLNTILSICVGLQLDYEEIMRILSLAGLGLSTTNYDHIIYRRLLMSHLGPSPLETFNNVCETFHVKPLGKRDNRHRKLDE